MKNNKKIAIVAMLLVLMLLVSSINIFATNVPPAGDANGDTENTQPAEGDKETQPDGEDKGTQPDAGDKETQPDAGDKETKPAKGDEEKQDPTMPSKETFERAYIRSILHAVAGYEWHELGDLNDIKKGDMDAYMAKAQELMQAKGKEFPEIKTELDQKKKDQIAKFAVSAEGISREEINEILAAKDQKELDAASAKVEKRATEMQEQADLAYELYKAGIDTGLEEPLKDLSGADAVKKTLEIFAANGKEPSQYVLDLAKKYGLDAEKIVEKAKEKAKTPATGSSIVLAGAVMTMATAGAVVLNKRNK